jgi:Leucine-rich repeat (LRR) protein
MVSGKSTENVHFLTGTKHLKGIGSGIRIRSKFPGPDPPNRSASDRFRIPNTAVMYIIVVQEIGELSGLRELHLQGNRLTVLPPSLGSLDFLSSRAILKLDNNPWVPPIEDQLMLGVSHVIEYIRTGTGISTYYLVPVIGCYRAFLFQINI